MSPQPKLTAIIVSYNSADVLPFLLDSLYQQQSGGAEFDIVVVDNASADGSAALAATHVTAPQVLQTGRNAGYAAALNIGLAQVPAHHAVLLLNPDIRLCAGFVTTMMAGIKGSVGIVVPRLLSPQGVLHHSLRVEPSLITAWSEALLGGDRAARLGLGEIIAGSRRYQRRGLVDCASGAALLVSADARRRIGPWNESYFLYSEEIEFMHRARAKGVRILFEPDSVAVHVGGDSNRDPGLFSLLTLNRIRYYGERHGQLSTALFRLAVTAGLMLRLNQGAIYRPALQAAMTLSLGPFGRRFSDLSR